MDTQDETNEPATASEGDALPAKPQASVAKRQGGSGANVIRQAAKPKNLEEIKEIAQILYESGFFSDVKNAAQGTAKILAGAEMGLDPMESMRSIHAFDGSTSLHYTQVLALIRRSDKYEYKILESTEQKASIRFYRFDPVEKGWLEEGTQSWTIADAETAGLMGKQNWQKYPRAMLISRCATEGQRKFCPDVGGGPLYTPEELGAKVDEEGRALPGQSEDPPRSHRETEADPPDATSDSYQGNSSGANAGGPGPDLDRDFDQPRFADVDEETAANLYRMDKTMMLASPDDLREWVLKLRERARDEEGALGRYLLHLAAAHDARLASASDHGSGFSPSEGQIRLLYGVKNGDFSDEDLDALVKEGWGFESKNEIPSRQAWATIAFQLQDPRYRMDWSRKQPEDSDDIESSTSEDTDSRLDAAASVQADDSALDPPQSQRNPAPPEQEPITEDEHEQASSESSEGTEDFPDPEESDNDDLPF